MTSSSLSGFNQTLSPLSVQIRGPWVSRKVEHTVGLTLTPSPGRSPRGELQTAVPWNHGSQAGLVSWLLPPAPAAARPAVAFPKVLAFG